MKKQFTKTMQLRNPNVKIGAVNHQDDLEMADGLEAMLQELAEESPQEKETRISKMKYICGFPNPKYRGEK